MNTYNTYQEAKIANPNSEIIQPRNLDNLFRALGNGVYTGWNICNPADHCMTVEKFLADGYKFVEGDLIYSKCIDAVVTVSNCGSGTRSYIVESSNELCSSDNGRYILRAAALGEKKPHTKVEYVKCDIESRGQALDAFDNEIELFKLVEGEYKQVATESDAISKWRNLYERIETPMTEREAFIDAACNEVNATLDSDAAEDFGKIFDSGKFKLVN